MPLRPCMECGRISDQARCPDHRRGSREERGYDYQHRLERAEWVPLVAEGNVLCRRAQYGECIEDSPYLEPGETFDLDHPDDEHPAPKAPAHPRCNRGASRRGR